MWPTLTYNPGTFLTALKKATRNLNHTSGLRFKTGSTELISTWRKRRGSPLFNVPISSAFILTLRLLCLWGETAQHPLARGVCGSRLQHGLSN
jgi:hypothetical protein